MPPPSTPFKNRAFTLIELLTVITIIAVLAGLLFPVASSVLTSARKTQASSDMTRIVTSVASYQTEYGRLPLNTRQGASATVYGDPGDGAYYPSFYLFDILRAIPENNLQTGNKYNYDDQLNPKGVVYFEAPNAKNPDKPRSGFVTKPEGYLNPVTNYTIRVGSLVDPWGSEYMVWLDGSGSENLYQPIQDIYQGYNPPLTDPQTQQKIGPRVAVGATSLGPDGMKGNKGTPGPDGGPDGTDDISTWK